MYDHAVVSRILSSLIAIGSNALATLPSIMDQIGATAPLVMYSHQTRRASLQDLVLRSLATDTQNNLVTTAAMEREQNPLTMAIDISRTIREQHLDCIIAIGGTSILDTARLASYAISVEADTPEELLRAATWNSTIARNPERRNIKIISIPTTVGTGGEAGDSAISIDRTSHTILWLKDERLRPTAVVVDPHMTRPLPPGPLAAGLLTTFANAFGILSSGKSDPISGAYARKSMVFAQECLRKSSMHATDAETRIQSGTASLLAGLAGCTDGPLISQSIALAVQAYADIPYCQAFTMLFPLELQYRWETMRAFAGRAADLHPMFSELSTITSLSPSMEIPSLIAAWIRDSAFTAGNPFPLRFLDMTNPDGSKALESMELGSVARLALSLPGMQRHTMAMDEQDALRLLESAYWGYPLDIRAIQKGYRHSFHREFQ